MRGAAFCGQSLWRSVRFLFCRGGTIMLETITSVNGVVNGIVWGRWAGAAVWHRLSADSAHRFFQLRYFGYWMRHTIGPSSWTGM